MAHTKAGGKVAEKTPRAGKRLGVKIFGAQAVKKGEIIIRQRGSKVICGTGVEMGRDFTIFAMRNGKVKFQIKQGKSIVSVF